MRVSRGTGVRCTICRELISREQTDMTIEFAHTAPRVEVFHLHANCCGAWDFARMEFGGG